MNIVISPGTITDLTSITQIYNVAVESTTATFDNDPQSNASMRERLLTTNPRHPLLVAASGETLLGWGKLYPWSVRSGYDQTAEVAVYIDREWQGRGLGVMLGQALLKQGKQAGLHTVIARITSDNTPSIRLHERLGYALIGTLRESGFKFGRFWDVGIYQKILN